MLRGLPFRNEEGWWSGHSGQFLRGDCFVGFLHLGFLLLVGSLELQQCHSLRHCMNAQDKYHGCTCTNVGDARGMHMFAVVCIFQLKPYSNHFHLPRLYNLRYNCSSSVNDLAPAPKHILKLG